VKGSIDDFQIKQYKLMPMGNQRLFLPVKAAIRKKIRKEAGDTVRIILYSDESQIEIPPEILDCFKVEPKKIYENFLTLSEGNQKAYLDWIYEAKTVETKTKRIISMMDKVERKMGFYENEEGKK
jgi:uncharacterized protein YdeI (YjbR/CyaY-like superfamily)